MTDDRARIDGETIRDRLRRSETAFEAATGVSAERLAAIYRERAAALADRRAATTRADGPRVLVFELSGERYGLDFHDIAELLPFAGCAPVPGGPPELLGVIGVRGELRSVLDLGRMLGLPAGEPCGYVVLARSGGRTCAFRVDQLDAVRPLTDTAPTDGAVSPFVRGITADRVRLLDTAAIFAHPVLRPAAVAPPAEGGSPR